MSWPIILGLALLIVGFAYWPEIARAARGALRARAARRTVNAFERFSHSTARLLLSGGAVRYEDRARDHHARLGVGVADLPGCSDPALSAGGAAIEVPSSASGHPSGSSRTT